jgi:hypothetical protein
MKAMLVWMGTLCLLASGFLFFQSRRLSEQSKDGTLPLGDADRLTLEERSNRMFMQAFVLFLFGVACKILNSYPRALDSIRRLFSLD